MRQQRRLLFENTRLGLHWRQRLRKNVRRSPRLSLVYRKSWLCVSCMNIRSSGYTSETTQPLLLRRAMNFLIESM